MADRGEGGGRGGGERERFGRGTRGGLDGGVSRNAHTSGSRRGSDAARDASAGRGGEFGAGDTGAVNAGTGGYGASSGFSGGTSGARGDRRDSANRRTGGSELEPGATEASTRAGNVGHQAESGMETRPEEGSTANSGELGATDRGTEKRPRRSR